MDDGSANEVDLGFYILADAAIASRLRHISRRGAALVADAVIPVVEVEWTETALSLQASLDGETRIVPR